MMADSERAVRTLHEAAEVRDASAGSDSIGTLTGYMSAANVWYPVESRWEGQFIERIMPGAFRDSIERDRGDLRALFNHGFDPTIAKKVLGPITELREDGHGVRYEVELFDTSYNRDLLPGLKAGVYGSSMHMHVPEDGQQWNNRPVRSEYNPEGMRERTITRAQLLDDLGPVTFPANPGSSAGVMRSTTDWFYDRLRESEPEAYAGALRERVRRVGELRAAPGPGDRDMLNRVLVALAQIDNITDQWLVDLSGYLGVPNPDESDDNRDDPTETAVAGAALGRDRDPLEAERRMRRDNDTLRLLGIIKS